MVKSSLTAKSWAPPLIPLVAKAAYQGSGYFSKVISGTTYYGNTVNKANVGKDQPIMAMFDAQGKFVFGVMTVCGNPVGTSPVTPTYGCDALHKTPVAGKMNTFNFTTTAHATNNASVSKVVYDFGDGTTATVANPNTPVQHAYTKSGSFTAKVTVYVHLPGNQNVTAVSTNCQTTFTIVQPFYACTQLTGAVLNKANYSYTFTATAKFRWWRNLYWRKY